MVDNLIGLICHFDCKTRQLQKNETRESKEKGGAELDVGAYLRACYNGDQFGATSPQFDHGEILAFVTFHNNSLVFGAIRKRDFQVITD